MLIFYRVAHGRDAVTESIRTGTALLPQYVKRPTPSIIKTDFSSLDSEFLPSPVKSRTFDSLRRSMSYPPPYRCHDFMGGIPPSPSVDLGYIKELNYKRTTWS